ncbi:MAG: glucose-6-phosphate isomerase [Alphaproteobacteria bacterium]|nr:glucose-6-phosphate isomerase [Alphaproteobacteria bacterium]
MANSPFSVSLDLALSGAGAPPAAAYDAALAASASALDWLREQKKSGGLELLGIPARTDDLKAATKQAAALKGFSTVAVLGIGGSSLGGQALTALRKVQKPFVEFHDNPDPFAWAAALKRFDLKKTHFIAISKSGGTAETLMQALTAAEALEKAGVKKLKKHFTIVTEPHASPLADFADSIGAVKLDHPLGVGGRYSVLTMVGIVPALAMGLNVKQLRAGAAAALDQVLKAKKPADAPAAVGAALHKALADQGKLATTILWPYADALAVFGGWWRQLWAESLGKDGQGSTPVSVLGPVDQHSQLQLFRDGPGNALFTLMQVATKGKGLTAPKGRAKKLGLDYLAGRKMGDLVDAECRATAQTLFKNGRPVRVIHLEKVDEFHMGALMMHFMLETIVMGRLMGVDPFDQPGVEEGKVLARQYLAEG